MAVRTKTCLTCGKTMTPVALYCPRCGSAFLRISDALSRATGPQVYQSAHGAEDTALPPQVRPQWEMFPVEFVRPWPWYLGRVLKRAWGLMLAYW
jgi:predicted RNA-binding Zn-ribbon protein involved in translation (DUF1610 family)